MGEEIGDEEEFVSALMFSVLSRVEMRANSVRFVLGGRMGAKKRGIMDFCRVSTTADPRMLRDVL